MKCFSVAHVLYPPREAFQEDVSDTCRYHEERNHLEMSARHERLGVTRAQLSLIGNVRGMLTFPMRRTSPSFLDRLVGEPNGACRVRLGGDQSQRRSACVLKEPLALAQDQRTDDERILIDEVMVHERADKVTTTQDRYVLTKLLLELGHFFGDIALDQPGIVPCHPFSLARRLPFLHRSGARRAARHTERGCPRSPYPFLHSGMVRSIGLALP